MALNGFLFLLKEISNAENKMKIKREGFYQEIIMVFIVWGVLGHRSITLPSYN